jgi:hypothetical protein
MKTATTSLHRRQQPACAVCTRPAAFACARCNAAFYCNVAHQQAHWTDGGHAEECALVGVSVLSSADNGSRLLARMTRFMEDHQMPMSEWQEKLRREWETYRVTRYRGPLKPELGNHVVIELDTSGGFDMNQRPLAIYTTKGYFDANEFGGSALVSKKVDAWSRFVGETNVILQPLPWLNKEITERGYVLARLQYVLFRGFGKADVPKLPPNTRVW